MTAAIDEEIAEFLTGNQVATICCSEDNVPYCFSCFYTTMEKEKWIVFKSSFGTRHGEILNQNCMVAGTILPKELNPAVIQGIQFEGTAKTENEISILPAVTAYYLKYPVAMTMPGKVWVIELDSIKLTDNSKGFGYKCIWKK